VRSVFLLAVAAGCYPGVDNSDCKITCGADGACPSNLSCAAGFCVAEGQICTDPDLAAAYSFDALEPDGRIADLSGNGNSITLHGNATLGSGHTGKALAFDGIDAFGSIAVSPSLTFDGAFTVSFWAFIVPDSTTTDDVLIGKLSGDSFPTYEWGVEFDDAGSDDMNLLISDSDQQYGPFVMDAGAGRFAYIAYAYDGVDITGYVDGEQQAIANSHLDVLMKERPGEIRLGADGEPRQFFTGSLDDLRIYRRALTAQEIARDMLIGVQ